MLDSIPSLMCLLTFLFQKIKGQTFQFQRIIEQPTKVQLGTPITVCVD